ncbi:hypothetical protein [Gudongella sp. SC589]|uniref:hypothetical protein n=1 Tax=Gudongella sp. SC589 TaxID=3385990 RepID=UPI00390470C9
MANISQNVNIEMLEKLPDGTYKRKYPKTRSDSGVTFDEHLAENTTQVHVNALASEAEAVAGETNNKFMTPLRVKEQIATHIVRGSFTGDGIDDRVINVGFAPDAVFIYGFSNAYPDSRPYQGIILQDLLGLSWNYTGTIDTQNGIGLTSVGFRVSNGNSAFNTSGFKGYYLAIKA